MDDRASVGDATLDDTASADTQSPTEEPRARAQQPLQLSGYELGDVLGRGGMGEVIAALDINIEREVAIKCMRGTAGSREATERFLREAKIQARLDHPAIVPVHELGEDAEGRPFFTMKRLTGTTLLAKLQREPGGRVQPLLRAFADVCFAIELAHSRGIVHRDLKPANIMLGDYNEVYVLDWGVARVLRTERVSRLAIDSDVRDGMTQAGAMLGTPGYMAPEQMRGEDVTTAADVYSLGAILFELLAGQPLHAPGSGAIASTLSSPTESPARRAAASGRQVPPELDALCVEALAEEPGRRPTARALAERVQRYLDGDRDAERRREIATRELAIAHDAIASGEPARRLLAAQSAARALAFDPTSREAADLVAHFILEPPEKDPPDLVTSLEESERKLRMARSRRAVPAFLAIFVWLPFALAMNIESTAQLVGLFASCTIMAGIVWWNSRTGTVPAWVLLVGNGLTALMFSRLASPFMIMPSLICGQLLALSTHTVLERKKWLLAGWSAAAFLAPLALEQLGVFGSTWWVGNGGIVTHSTIIETRGPADVWALIFGQTALVIVVALYASSYAKVTRAAQLTAHRQAWHLQQLLPRAMSRLP